MQNQAQVSQTDSAQAVHSPHALHAERRNVLQHDKERAARVSGTISTLRLVTLVGALAIGGGLVFAHMPRGAGYGAWALLLAFIALVAWHARLHRRLLRIEMGIAYHDLALARLTAAWTATPSRGDAFASDQHPYSGDLNLFGRASVFQMLDGTHTFCGERKLADWLRTPSSLDEIRARQAATRDLADRPRFRETLAVEGMLITGAHGRARDAGSADPVRPDPQTLFAWAEAEPSLRGPTPRVAAWFAPAIAAGVTIAGSLGAVSTRMVVLVLVAEWLLNFSFLRVVESVFSVVGTHSAALLRYHSMLELIEREPFEAPTLRALAAELSPRASASVRSLSRITAYFDARHNEVFKLILGPLLLWDVHCVLALDRWKLRAGRGVRRWIGVVGEIEALASLGSHAADHPDDAWPELVEQPVFRAAGLGHPLLPPDTCVRNDVELAGAGTALLVTGSNMSGKSTLLRATGVNLVLALAGAPVRARSMQLSVFDLRTSMSARDSLEQGVSFFYAEVQKLKRVVDGLAAPRPLFFLLDEILQGTNSRERSIGARTVLRHLVEHGAMGAVSTHDVNLWQLGPELEPHLIKVHFEEQVATAEGDEARMSFDYRLRPGIVRSSNALRLMKLVGIDLDFPAD